MEYSRRLRRGFCASMDFSDGRELKVSPRTNAKPSNESFMNAHELNLERYYEDIKVAFAKPDNQFFSKEALEKAKEGAKNCPSFKHERTSDESTGAWLEHAGLKVLVDVYDNGAVVLLTEYKGEIVSDIMIGPRKRFNPDDKK